MVGCVGTRWVRWLRWVGCVGAWAAWLLMGGLSRAGSDERKKPGSPHTSHTHTPHTTHTHTHTHTPHTTHHPSHITSSCFCSAGVCRVGATKLGQLSPRHTPHVCPGTGLRTSSVRSVLAHSIPPIRKTEFSSECALMNRAVVLVQLTPPLPFPPPPSPLPPLLCKNAIHDTANVTRQKKKKNIVGCIAPEQYDSPFSAIATISSKS